MKTLIILSIAGMVLSLMQACETVEAATNHTEIQTAKASMIELGLAPAKPEKIVLRSPARLEQSNLAGFCADRDRRQFDLAKDFAYDMQGLNMSNRDAASWALAYNQNHGCGTIREFRARYEVLYRVAYDIDSLNLSTAEAREFALHKAEATTTGKAGRMGETLKTVKDFMYAIDGLNLGSQEAKSRAREWIERGSCEDARQVQDVIAPAFRKEYRLAYAMDGLNLSSIDSREYASRQIWDLSRCSDLIRL